MAPAELKELNTQLDELLEKRLYPAQYISIGSPSIVREKKVCNHEIVHILSGIKQNSGQEQLPFAQDR